MIKLENTETAGWKPALRGMRNPMNSWSKADSFKQWDSIGDNDHALAMRLRNAGTDHRKFMRMIICYVDITAPLYWWKEFDTYRNGVEKNSCSTMHKIAERRFTIDDFSHEHLSNTIDDTHYIVDLKNTIACLNVARERFLKTKDKNFWWQMIQLLPSTYNQKRTCMISYEALANMYHARKAHKLDEWREFCKWIESLPYSEFITGVDKVGTC